MSKQDAILLVDNPLGRCAVVTLGAPFAAGTFPAGAGLRVMSAGQPLLCWSEPRSLWPDGSVRWLWVHVSVPAGENVLVFEPAEPADPVPAALEKRENGWQMSIGGQEFRVAAAGAVDWSHKDARWEFSDRGVRVDGQQRRPGLGRVELVEASPLAPLLRIVCEQDKELRIETRLRLLAEEHILLITRRLTNLSSDQRRLESTGIDLRAQPDVRWEMPGVCAGDRWETTYVAPGKFLANGQEQSGYPDCLVTGPVHGLFLEKAWQRYPAAVAAAGSALSLHLYPPGAGDLRLWSGTSLRHSFRLGLGDEAVSGLERRPAWHWSPEYLCATKVFGPLAAATEKSRYFFAGYETAVRQAFEGLRLAFLDGPGCPSGPPAPLEAEEKHAPEYFGLPHYGDWPLEWGRYAGPDPHHRIYADNEYDIPYAFFQQFARTGDSRYLDIAREGAVHMADLDMDMVAEKMFYHGYLEYGEDHDRHRAPPGVGDHSWTEGFWSAYFLLGDVWAREAAEAVGRSLLKGFAGDTDDAVLRHWFCCERTVGWPMIQLTGNAEANGDRTVLAKVAQMAEYLARYFADPDRRFLETDTFDGRRFKWFRAGAQDGTKTLMLAIVLEGLERYHRLTGDTAAIETMRRIADFLIARMWDPIACQFRYELNAYNRHHRKLDPVPGILPVRSLAYLYEATGHELYRTVAKEAFFGAFWVLASGESARDPEGNAQSIRSARDLGIVMRSANAALYWLMEWKDRAESLRRRRMASAGGRPWSFDGPPEALPRDENYVSGKTTPVFGTDGTLSASPRFNKDGELVQDGDNYLAGRLREPAAARRGRIVLAVRNRWPGEESGAVCQRGWFHLSADSFTATAVSIISFYGRVHARFYDADRVLIESVDADIRSWRPGETHTVEVSWDEESARLAVDGGVAAQRALDRGLGGCFTTISVGYHPAHWSFEGDILHLTLTLE